MSDLVLDASCAAAWVLEDEATPQTATVLAQLQAGARAIVPPLWRWEMANLLLVGAQRGRIDATDVDAALVFLDSLPIALDTDAPSRAWPDALTLARDHALSVYDASYLELALRRRSPLATLDRPLARAAAAVGVTLLLGS